MDVTTARMSITEIYTAAFNRVPDTAGLAFWVDSVVNKGQTLNQVSQNFTTSVEYKALYPTFLTTTEYIDKIYQNVFGRAADAAGETFWVGKLADGSLTSGTVMQAMLDAAHANGSADGTRLTNLATYGVYCALNNVSATVAAQNLSTITADPASVTAAEGVVIGTTGQTFTLTTGVDTVTGGTGNDTFNGLIDSTITATTAQPASTFTALDTINGGDGVDVLNLNALTAVAALPAVAVTSVETVNLRAAAAFTGNFSGFTGLTALNVTQAAGALVLTEAATTAVTISGADAAVTTNGGQSITIAKTMDTVVDAITVKGGGAVTVTATNSNSVALGIDIGNTTAVTGAVVVNSTGAAIVGGTGPVALDTISVNGGTTVNVTQHATSSMGNVATAGIITDVVTQGAVTVTGGAATTSVTVVQDDQAAAIAAVAAITAVPASQTITFSAVAAGGTVTVDGLVFHATKAITAAEAAAAFANLSTTEIQGQGYSSNGYYTSVTAAAVGYTSGAVVGDTVTFTQKTAAPVFTSLVVAASGTAPTVAASTIGVAAQTGVTGVLGVASGIVVIDDNASAVKTITTVTVDSYANSTIGTTNSLNALTTLSLANSAGTMSVTTTAAALGLTVNDIQNNVALADASLKTLNITTATKDSAFAFTGTALGAVETLTVAGTNALNLGATALTALKTVTVSGAAGLTVDASAATVTAVNTAATTGTVTASIDATKATYTGGAGVDNVTTTAIAPTKAISLGAGNDTMTLFGGTVAMGALGTINGGDGTDTLSMVAADAATASLTTPFALAVTGFEHLTLTGATGNQSVDVTKLGAYNYVTSAGRSGLADTLTIDKLVTGGTLAITTAATAADTTGSITVNVTDATLAANTTDVLNILVSNTAGIAAGVVKAAGVETVNITSTDSLTPFTGVHTLTLVDTAAKTITVAGNAGLNLTTTGNTALTLIDASTLTGALTATAINNAETIKGGSGADLLTAAGNSVILNGGAGNDTFIITGNLAQITTGAGADIVDFSAATVNVNSYGSVLDIASGDVIRNTATVAFVAAGVTLASGTAVFQDYANAAVNAAGANTASWFQYGGNTYVVENVAAGTTDNFINGVDQVIQIVGLVDLSTASFSAANGTIQIA